MAAIWNLDDFKHNKNSAQIPFESRFSQIGKIYIHIKPKPLTFKWLSILNPRYVFTLIFVISCNFIKPIFF